MPKGMRCQYFPRNKNNSVLERASKVVSNGGGFIYFLLICYDEANGPELSRYLLSTPVPVSLDWVTLWRQTPNLSGLKQHFLLINIAV